jgi:hypothetical protein
MHLSVPTDLVRRGSYRRGATASPGRNRACIRASDSMAEC